MHTEGVNEARQRGILRVYLGASPGVGKTFAMLDEGQRRAARGTDVVIGYVETHGRVHTEEQIGDLEVVPRRSIEHKGTVHEEMDLDAVLVRRPEVVLVDELNRVPARTQSAFFEAMAEGAVTADGVRHLLPQPFLLIATQNPYEAAGTLSQGCDAHSGAGTPRLAFWPLTLSHHEFCGGAARKCFVLIGDFDRHDVARGVDGEQ